jgi:3-mercaptopyruvate sulfurtransferase SseA
VHLAESHAQVLLVRDDGRMSAMVARTLKFAGIADPLYLSGGLQAWAAQGGALLETSSTGQEHRIPRVSRAEAAARRLASLGMALNARILYLGLAGAAALLVGMALWLI